MPRRPLSPDEAALWQRVSATVRALPGRAPSPALAGAVAKPPPGTPRLVVPRAAAIAPPMSRPQPRSPGETLDKTWDRRLATGGVIPDRTIDLHGHTLASAHAALDTGLDRAIRAGDRVVLLVTGRPPRAESERPHARGAIRAAIGDWLMLSRHAGCIAALRHAHPRHGGQGALYVVLRRPRD